MQNRIGFWDIKHQVSLTDWHFQQESRYPWDSMRSFSRGAVQTWDSAGPSTGELHPCVFPADPAPTGGCLGSPMDPVTSAFLGTFTFVGALLDIHPLPSVQTAAEADAAVGCTLRNSLSWKQKDRCLMLHFQFFFLIFFIFSSNKKDWSWKSKNYCGHLSRHVPWKGAVYERDEKPA